VRTQEFSQVEGLDFREIFAPIARLEGIMILLAFAIYKGFKLYHMDVKIAFLNGVIQEEGLLDSPHVSRTPNIIIECTRY
jgi:hypothetical protein